VLKLILDGIMYGLEFTVFLWHSYKLYLQIHIAGQPCSAKPGPSAGFKFQRWSLRRSIRSSGSTSRPLALRASSTKARMVMSASSARRASCLRSAVLGSNRIGIPESVRF
jgi:hypothetical protein